MKIEFFVSRLAHMTLVDIMKYLKYQYLTDMYCVSCVDSIRITQLDAFITVFFLLNHVLNYI